MGTFVSEFLKFAESELNFPAGVILDLPNEDHWSFIIKIHAIAERSMNRMLTVDIKDEPLEEMIIRQTFEAKVNLAEQQKIIDSDSRAKFKTMSRLRNKAAHNILFNFDEIFKDQDLLNAYKSAFSNVWTDPVELGGTTVTNARFVAENPRATIFLGIVGSLAFAKLEAEIKQLTKNAEKIAEVIGSFNGPKKGLLR
jgi:hypothetical protein